jgi:predicted nucleic acid-binding protein
MIVLDASVLIGYLDANDAHHVRAERLLSREADDDFAVNSLTLGQALVAPTREGRLDTVQAALRDLEVRELGFPGHAAVRLAQIRCATGCRMPGWCVLVAAEEARARIASFDARLIRAAESRKLVVVSQ